MLNKFLIISFSFLSLVVLSSISSSEVYAQRTCCNAAAPTSDSQCLSCDNSGKYWKNLDGRGVSSNCSSPWGCQASDGSGDWLCTGSHPYGNACGGSSSTGGACRYPSTTPVRATLTVGEKMTFASNAFANGVTMGAFRSASSDLGVAKTTPTSKNICCEWSYSYRQLPVESTVTAVSLGSAGITNKFVSSDGKSSCQVTVPVNVVAFAACYEGMECSVVEGGDITVGKNISCVVPAVPSTEVAKKTVSYEVKCDVYDSNGSLVSAGVVSQSSTSNTLPSFAVTKAGEYRCSFRYCLKNASSTVCSDWGK